MVKSAIAMAAAVTAVLGGAASAAPLSGSIRIDGSSTVYPVSSAIVEEFKRVQPGVEVTVGVSGTGGGFKRFIAGETDISDASRPITKSERDGATKAGIEFIELPIAIDGLSIVVNKSNTWVDALTIEDLRKIYSDSSNVATWRDVRPNWPATPIKMYSPGTASGTFDYFKEVVVGNKGSIRRDMSVSEDDNVLVRGVEGETGAIGFFGFAYYVENQDHLKIVPIDAGKGAVAPTRETIQDGAYAPFSRPLFLYVNRKSADRPEVKAFVDFYLENAAAMAEEVGYVAAPKAVHIKAAKNFAARSVGTQFLSPDGEEVHGRLEDVYK